MKKLISLLLLTSITLGACTTFNKASKKENLLGESSLKKIIGLSVGSTEEFVYIGLDLDGDGREDIRGKYKVIGMDEFENVYLEYLGYYIDIDNNGEFEESEFFQVENDKFKKFIKYKNNLNPTY